MYATPLIYYSTTHTATMSISGSKYSFKKCFFCIGSKASSYSHHHTGSCSICFLPKTATMTHTTLSSVWSGGNFPTSVSTGYRDVIINTIDDIRVYYVSGGHFLREYELLPKPPYNNISCVHYLYRTSWSIGCSWWSSGANFCSARSLRAGSSSKHLFIYHQSFFETYEYLHPNTFTLPLVLVVLFIWWNPDVGFSANNKQTMTTTNKPWQETNHDHKHTMTTKNKP